MSSKGTSSPSSDGSSDFDPNDVAEVYDLDGGDYDAELDALDDGEAEDDEMSAEELNDESLAAFEGFEDTGEPSTFDFKVHNGK